MIKPRQKRRSRNSAKPRKATYRARGLPKSKVRTITMTVPLKASHFAALKKIARQRIRAIEAEIDRSLEPRYRPVARARVRLLRRYLDHLHATLVRGNRVLKEEVRRQDQLQARLFAPLQRSRSPRSRR